MKCNGEQPRFIADFMLGRLARWLRILGYDAKYVTEKNRFNSILESLRESRIILTRDHHLNVNGLEVIRIRNTHFGQQLLQLTRETGLVVSRKQLLSRCALCNTATKTITNKEEIRSLVPQYVYETKDEFSQCPCCRRIYWRGSHLALLLSDLEKYGIKVNQ
ncbi:MAG: hypothetical protein A2219_02365 [Elusimicrobia bacterium RIFOXYA2_FULL_50_26]|nr:MAG: hypothetical protein A2219_02365 [Elusimicrobia bacterium RIFOXYA2_FULL_50_26]OGS23750.1 MAG: hypothetical protein A2314_00745 [Elusimicrobia bacterium RIFOXYB2_FULL_50_12]